MLKSICLALALVAVPAAADAAIISFIGSLTSGSGGTIGTASVGSPINFTGRLEVAEGAATGEVTGGFLMFTSLGNLTLAPAFDGGGSSLVTLNPSVSAVFANVGLPNALPAIVSRRLSFTLPSSTVGGTIDQPTFDDLIGITSNTIAFVEVDDSFNSFTYTGSITATPEPGSLVAFSLLAATVGGVKLRRRSKATVAA